jgi:hypothetical protein
MTVAVVSIPILSAEFRYPAPRSIFLASKCLAGVKDHIMITDDRSPGPAEPEIEGLSIKPPFELESTWRSPEQYAGTWSTRRRRWATADLLAER